MAEMKAQQYLQTYYAQRGEQRGNHARRASGDAGRPLRRVVPARHPAGGGRAVSVAASSRGSAPRPSTRRPGRQGLVDADLRQIVPGSRACGPARTVRCGQDDNLMVHAAMARAAARRGARAHDARAGAGRAGRRPARHPGQGPRRRRRSSSTPPCATARSWRRWACRCGRAGSARAARPRTIVGELDVPVTRRRRRRSGRATSWCSTPTARPWSPPSAPTEVLDGVARARGEGGASSATKLQAGALSYELDGLRAVVEGA